MDFLKGNLKAQLRMADRDIEEHEQSISLGLNVPYHKQELFLVEERRKSLLDYAKKKNINLEEE